MTELERILTEFSKIGFATPFNREISKDKVLADFPYLKFHLDFLDIFTSYKELGFGLDDDEYYMKKSYFAFDLMPLEEAYQRYHWEQHGFVPIGMLHEKTAEDDEGRFTYYLLNVSNENDKRVYQSMEEENPTEAQISVHSSNLTEFLKNMLERCKQFKNKEARINAPAGN